MNSFNDENLNFDFLTEDDPIKKPELSPLIILIADDDIEVHTITKMILRDFDFEGHPLNFIDSYSGIETKKILSENNDIAVIFLDVVMENNNSGLEVVEYLRKTLNNYLTRIVLRTGQPGEAPEDTIIKSYDINDYRLKTEMTVQRLNTTLYTALRNYRDLKRIEKNRIGLEKIITASADLFRHNSLEEFFNSILNQLSSFYSDDTELLCIREETDLYKNGFVTFEQMNKTTIVAATGKYSSYIGKPVCEIPILKDICSWMIENSQNSQEIHHIANGFIIKKSGKNNLNNYIYIEDDKSLYDFDLINLFLTNYSIALDNYILNSLVSNTQKEIIITLGEVVEKHFDDTGGHIRRISEIMYQFALLNNFSYAESEMIKVASTMHDVGKIAIPDNILKKPGKLTAEEFVIVKEHPSIGYQILSNSKLDILKLASEIALNHHEKYDGTGYPSGLKEKEIPLVARMMAIVDVFDAMTHSRCYKDADSVESTIAYMKSLSGSHFDPVLLDIFVENFPKIAQEIDL